MGTRVGYWFAANDGGSTALSTVRMSCHVDRRHPIGCIVALRKSYTPLVLATHVSY
jgi:hypothetical protein